MTFSSFGVMGILILADKDKEKTKPMTGKTKTKRKHLDDQRAFLMKLSQVWQTHRALFREIESRLGIVN